MNRIPEVSLADHTREAAIERDTSWRIAKKTHPEPTD
jgi:hypothetical protein